jgi:hypothetical protein
MAEIKPAPWAGTPPNEEPDDVIYVDDGDKHILLIPPQALPDELLGGDAVPERWAAMAPVGEDGAGWENASAQPISIAEASQLAADKNTDDFVRYESERASGWFRDAADALDVTAAAAQELRDAAQALDDELAASGL